MPNRYANLVGSNKIKDEYTKINTGFDRVQQEMDAEVAAREFLEDRVDTIIQGGGPDKDAELVDIRTPDPAYTPERTINVAGDIIRDMQAQFVKNMFPVFNVKAFGAKGDYDPVTKTGTDDTAAIQAAIDAVSAAGGGTVYFPFAYYRTTSGLVVPNHFIKIVGDYATIIYDADTGIALDYNQAGSYIWQVGLEGITIRKKTETWGTGAIGVRMKATQRAYFVNFAIENFDIGLYLHGIDGHGTAYNTILPRSIINNKTNIALAADNNGWCNENTFIGGQLTYFSGRAGGYAGTINVHIGHYATFVLNNNKFIGVNFESASSETKAILCEGAYNFFQFCRYETSVAIEFTSNSRDNVVFYGNNVARANITDNGLRNCVFGREGINIFGGTITSQGVARFSNSGSVAYPSVEFLSPTKSVVGSVDGNGNFFGNSMQVNTGGTNGIKFSNGRIIVAIVGSPEGVVTAPPGSIAINGNGGAGATLWVKESGTGNTGWVAK